MKKLIFLLILLIAIYFRFNNLNWDANYHLHPDERFLTMIGSAMSPPPSFLDYLNPPKSTFNPTNIGYKFFVYGRFPLILNKIFAGILKNDNYNSFTIQGRFLSALFDLLIVILVYKTAQLLNKKNISNFPLWSAFFYAIAVLPIQLSHFFAVDTFLNFFMFGSFYFALKYSQERILSIRNIVFIISAILFGLSLACKVTAIYILPLILLVIFIGSKNSFKKYLILNTLYLILIYFTLRLADPYIFQSTNMLDPRPNQVFINNLKTLQSFSGKDIWYPPAVQWINKPAVIFSLVNLGVFGVGLPYFILVMVGICWIILNFKFLIFNKFNSNFKFQISNLYVFIILLWVISFFLYQSTQFAQPMRYFIFIYPFLAIFAGIGAEKIINYLLLVLRAKNKYLIQYTLYSVLFFLILIWPLIFSSIYLHKHTRIEASEWIYKNLPAGSLILGEEWDDPLPLSIQKTDGKLFKIEILPVFGMDTAEKWQKMNELLNRADYYVLSSNRGWGSIPTVPEKYPLMSKFYNDLLDDKLSYKKIKEFKPFYNRFFELPNHWIDESFTVYDHPTVMVYKNEKNN